MSSDMTQNNGMKLSEFVQNGICRISLEGRFDANTCSIVEMALRQKLDKGIHFVVLDMSKVPFVSSAGLRIILVFTKELRQKYRGDLLIAALQPNVKKVFEISGLNTVLRIFLTIEDAIKELHAKYER